MRASTFCMVVLILGFWLSSSVCSAQPLSSSELITNAKKYDGKTIVYEGEAVGDIMRRGNYAWINILDGQNAIGVWLPLSLVKEVSFGSGYKERGDGIEITGVFHNSCLEHGGDLDIHAQAVRKIASGRKVQERLNSGKKNLAIIFLIILCLIWILTLLKRK
ncbi:MAG TPA: DNA-binding protein [Candidatus Margulisiibacteriota bacterium]|nr:DNA-binding protein [Candidatus Margulisiibacteriota bacterium]